MNKYISDAKDRVSLEVSKIINDANTSTADLINCMTNVSDDVKTIINKVSVMGDMITDLRVLNGTAKSITPISELPVVSNSGVYIKDNEIGLDLSSQVSKEVDANKATIISTLPYSLYNKDVSTELSLLFKSNTSTKVLFDTSGFSFSVVLPFSDMEQINCIDIKLDLDTEIYPIINSIKYVDQNNLIKDTPILDTQDKSIDLDENRVKDNLYSIHISPVISNQIIIEFVSKTGSSVTFNSIKPKYNKREISGEAIFGPYVSQEPILKLAVDSDSITSGVSLYISGDKENWRPLTNSSSFGSEKKILSFNTINKDSQKLTEDLYRVYIKVAIQSSKITNETSLVSVYDTYREDGIISNDIMASIPNNLLSAYRIKNSDYLYGKYSYNNTCNISNLDLNKIEQIDVEGVPKVMGITTTKYSVSNNYDSSLGVASVGCELKSLRLPSNSVVDAKGFDVANSKLVDIYTLPVNKRINIKQKDNLCFTLNVKEDVYTIISKDTRKYLTLDLTTPFIKNSSAALIQVPNEDILIRDSLGNTLVTITKDKLLQLDDIYFLNLVGTLYTPLLVSGLVYSPYYPIKELNDGEYALLEGKIVATSGVLFDVQGYELLRSEVNCTRVVNYTNGNYIKRLDDSYTYYHEQELDVSEPVTVLKLDSVSIAKGSLVIEDSSYKQNNYINYKVTKLSASRQDNTSPYDLVVELSNNTVLNSDCYIDIIADKSSAVITKIDDRNYKISNPTDTTVKVSIIYKGMNISHEYIDLKGILGWGNSGYVKGDIGDKEQPLNKSISCDGAIGEVIMGLNKVSSDSICTVTVELDSGKKYSMSKTYADFNKPIFQGNPISYTDWIDVEINQPATNVDMMLFIVDANEELNRDIYGLELINFKNTNQIVKKLSVNNTIILLDENPNKTVFLNDDGSVSFCLSKLDTGNSESSNNKESINYLDPIQGNQTIKYNYMYPKYTMSYLGSDYNYFYYNFGKTIIKNMEDNSPSFTVNNEDLKNTYYTNGEPVLITDNLLASIGYRFKSDNTAEATIFVNNISTGERYELYKETYTYDTIKGSTFDGVTYTSINYENNQLIVIYTNCKGVVLGYDPNNPSIYSSSASIILDSEDYVDLDKSKYGYINGRIVLKHIRDNLYCLIERKMIVESTFNAKLSIISFDNSGNITTYDTKLYNNYTDINCIITTDIMLMCNASGDQTIDVLQIDNNNKIITKYSKDANSNTVGNTQYYKNNYLYSLKVYSKEVGVDVLYVIRKNIIDNTSVTYYLLDITLEEYYYNLICIEDNTVYLEQNVNSGIYKDNVVVKKEVNWES